VTLVKQVKSCLAVVEPTSHRSITLLMDLRRVVMDIARGVDTEGWQSLAGRVGIQDVGSEGGKIIVTCFHISQEVEGWSGERRPQVACP
jgi:hypothetical protein